MQLAPIPFDEAKRMEALHRLHLLDSHLEERFDRITRIAHHLFDVPLVFITLIDHDRVWFKSRFGCDIQEEPRDFSICGHTICNVVTNDISTRLFEVVDTKEDERFKDNSFVVETCGTRYYLGFVLQSEDHHNIGTLCIIDSRPREISTAQKKILMDLGLMAEAELCNRQFSLHTNKTKMVIHNSSIDEHAGKFLKLSEKMESIQKQFNESLKTHGINYKEWRVLNEIAQTELASPHLISQKLGIAPPLITSRLNALEIKNLIERWNSRDGDRRFVHLTCSKRGREVWQKGIEEANQIGEAHLKNIIY